MINPYYYPAKIDLEMLSFDDPDAYYDFDTLCFWATKEGQIYSASDSGCSCPTPFEDYEGKDQREVIQKLERIGSIEQAEANFDSWNGTSYRSCPYLPASERAKVSEWVKARIK